jgi:hypothetical protein
MSGALSGPPSGPVRPSISVPPGAKVQVFDQRGTLQPVEIRSGMASFDVPIPGKRWYVVAGPQMVIGGYAHTDSQGGGVEFIPAGEDPTLVLVWFQRIGAPQQAHRAVLQGVAQLRQRRQ